MNSDKIKVACIGDSITYGWLLENRERDAYPAQLQRMLDEKFPGEYDVRNFGAPGRGVYSHTLFWDTCRAFRSMPEHLAALAWRPDIVICNLGANDWEEIEKERDGTLERGRFQREYLTLLDDYRALDSKPDIWIWTRLAPLTPPHVQYGLPCIPLLNAELEKVAEKARTGAIDIFTPLTHRKDWAVMGDGIHPTPEGSGALAEVTFQAVFSSLNDGGFAAGRDLLWTVLVNRFFRPETEALYDVLWRDGDGHVSATACLPTPEEIHRQFPNPCAWGTGMQDCVFNGAPFLSAAVMRGDRAMAIAAYRGLRRCATVSGVRGFVARGISPTDGRSFYFNSSRDTWTLFVYHLRAFSRSSFCDAATRAEIRDMLAGVAEYAEKCVTAENGYSLLRADGRPGLVCQMWTGTPSDGAVCPDGGLRPHEALRLPMIYAAAYDMTGNPHWRELKLRYIDKAIEISEGDVGDDIRASILNQMTLSIRLLRDTEDDLSRKTRLERLLDRMADMAAGPMTMRLEQAFGTEKWSFAVPMEDWRKFPFRKRWSCDGAWISGYRYDTPDSPVATIEDSYVEAAYAVLIQTLAPGRPVAPRTLRLFRRAIAATDLSAVACANAVNAVLAMFAAETQTSH